MRRKNAAHGCEPRVASQQRYGSRAQPSVVSRSTGPLRKRFNGTEMENKSMPAYLVYICQSVSDRKELETYWKEMPPTFMGFDVKLHTVYRSFELLEGEGPVEGV